MSQATSVHPAAPSDESNRSTFMDRFARREAWILGLLVLTVILVGVSHPAFLSLDNLRAVVADAAPVAIIACGVTLVVVTGEIDISVGSNVGFTAAILGLLSYGEHPLVPPFVGAAIAVVVATLVGMLNGLLVTLGRVPSIIVTLGTLTVLQSVTQLVMGGSSIYGRPVSLRDLATGSFIGVPISIWVAAAVLLASVFVVRCTALGMRIYAVGSNAKAAPLAGLSVGWTKFIVFTLTGAAAGIAALLIAPKNSLIQPNVGDGLELLVVTCVVVGGTSISGGTGTIFGSVLAVLLLSTVPTVLTYIGAPPQWRMAIQGAFILIAVLTDHLFRRDRRGFGGAA